jgi:hypothetical protein
MAEIHASYKSEQQFEDEAVERLSEAIALDRSREDAFKEAVRLLLEGGLDDVVAVDMEYAEQSVRIWKRVLGAL